MTGFAPVGAAPLGATAEGSIPLLLVDSAVMSAAYVLTHDYVDSAAITNPKPVQRSSTYVTDTGSLNDFCDTQIFLAIVDVAQVTEGLYPYHRTTFDVRETASLSDTATLSAATRLDIRDAATLGDVVELSVAYDIVSETAVVGDTAYVATVAYQYVLDTAGISDRCASVAVLDTVDALVASDSLYVRAVTAQNVVDTAVASSKAYVASTCVEIVTDSAGLSASEYFISRGIVDSADVGYMDDYATPRSASYNTVYTANVINFAMSTYSGLDLNSSAGDYAGSPRGLFKRSTEYADIELTTGHVDFGVANQKSVLGVYVDGERSEFMEIDVTADVNGAISTYTYAQMKRSADTQRTVRCDFGRGFRSNYVQLSLRSSGYAKLRSCEPIITALQRRV